MKAIAMQHLHFAFAFVCKCILIPHGWIISPRAKDLAFCFEFGKETQLTTHPQYILEIIAPIMHNIYYEQICFYGYHGHSGALLVFYDFKDHK